MWKRLGHLLKVIESVPIDGMRVGTLSEDLSDFEEQNTRHPDKCLPSVGAHDEDY